MTVLYEKPALNLRSELASLKNQGGYSEQQFWFENLVTNGTFDADVSGWTARAGTTISQVSGKLRVTGGATGYGTAWQAISCVVGKTYQLSVDISFPSTAYSTRVMVDIASTFGAPLTANTTVDASSGTKTVTFVADASTLYVGPQVYTATASSAADFDNISVFEVDANDDVVHRMPKGWVPKDVFEDGLLQREGSAHDYEVVYDGFDYYVKPAVAPSATTQTCVIGVRK